MQRFSPTPECDTQHNKTVWVLVKGYFSTTTDKQSFFFNCTKSSYRYIIFWCLVNLPLIALNKGLLSALRFSSYDLSTQDSQVNLVPCVHIFYDNSIMSLYFFHLGKRNPPAGMVVLQKRFAFKLLFRPMLRSVSSGI